MCFSFEVSMSTFIVSWSIALYLLSKKLKKYQKQNIIFLMIFSSVQLVDAILWYIKMKKNYINYITTSFLLPTILSLQVLYNVFIRNENTNLFITIFTIILCISIFVKFNGYSTALCNKNFSSPIWGSNEINVWEYIIFAVFIFYPYTIHILSNIAIFPIIYILVGGSYGSLWCAAANLFAFYYLYKY